MLSSAASICRQKLCERAATMTPLKTSSSQKRLAPRCHGISHSQAAGIQSIHPSARSHVGTELCPYLYKRSKIYGTFWGTVRRRGACATDEKCRNYGEIQIQSN